MSVEAGDCCLTPNEQFFSYIVARTSYKFIPVFGGLRDAHVYSFLCCVFLLCLSSSGVCVHNVASFFNCSFLIAPSVFSNVYLPSMRCQC